MKLLTLRLKPDLYALIKSRAEVNRRSMAAEIVFLVEGALAAAAGENFEIIRQLYLATSEQD